MQKLANISSGPGKWRQRAIMADEKYQSLLEELTEKNIKLRTKLRELDSLYRASKLMTSMQHLDHLLNGIVKLAARVLQAKTASVMLLDEATNELRIVASKGLGAMTAKKVRMKVGEGIAGYVVEYVGNSRKNSRRFKFE